jgi:hypothetical protein
MILHFHNARLIDPEAGTDETGSLTVKDGLILARDGSAPKALPPVSSTLASRSANRVSGTGNPSARRALRRRRGA